MALKSQPTLEMTIPDRRELVPSAAVVGLALLDDLQLLYVVRKKSFNVFVYDTTDQRQVSVTSRHATSAAAAAVFSVAV